MKTGRRSHGPRRSRLVPPCLSLAALVFLCGLVRAAGDGAGVEPAPSPPAPLESGQILGPFTLRLSLETGHDDNILSLSDLNRKAVVDGSAPAGKYLITTPDDWVTAARAALRWTGHPWSRRKTSVEGGVEVFRFARNNVMDSERYELDVSQELTATRRRLGRLRASVAFVPSRYGGELTDDDASYSAQHQVRNSETSARNEWNAGYEQEIVPDRLTGSLSLTGVRRDYNHYFDERDSRDLAWTAGATLRPFGRWRVSIGGDVTGGRRAARGDLSSTPVADDDVSFDYDGWSVHAAVPWGGRWRGRLELMRSAVERTYTSENASDFYHHDRFDRIVEGRCRLVQKLTRSLDLTLDFRRGSRRSRFPDFVGLLQEKTDYDRTRVGVGVIYTLR